MTNINLLKRNEIRELLKEVSGTDKFEKESAISWDNRNLIIRIPKEITDILGINEANRFKKNFKFIIDEKDGKKIYSFEIVERTKPPKEKIKDVSKKNNRIR